MATAASCVSPAVMTFFRKAVDSKCLHKYLGELEDERGYVHFDRAPKSWTKNVRNG